MVIFNKAHTHVIFTFIVTDCVVNVKNSGGQIIPDTIRGRQYVLTEPTSMHYLGSKRKLIPFIADTIHDVVGTDLSQITLCDIFAGTGVVGRAFKTSVQEVISNDMEVYAYILNRNYIGNHEVISDCQQYIDDLNQLPLVDDGFIFQNYCRGGGTDRQYFSYYNGQKIDTLRQGIESLKQSGNIDDNLYYFLLASLLESADEFANTTSHYTAYLKNLDSRAQKTLVLEPAPFEVNDNTHRVFNENANTLIKQIAAAFLSRYGDQCGIFTPCRLPFSMAYFTALR